jgi:hypothetical protein
VGRTARAITVALAALLPPLSAASAQESSPQNPQAAAAADEKPKAAPLTVEPVKVEPVTVNPVKVEPVPVQPLKVDMKIDFEDGMKRENTEIRVKVDQHSRALETMGRDLSGLRGSVKALMDLVTPVAAYVKDDAAKVKNERDAAKADAEKVKQDAAAEIEAAQKAAVKKEEKKEEWTLVSSRAGFNRNFAEGDKGNLVLYEKDLGWQRVYRVGDMLCIRPRGTYIVRAYVNELPAELQPLLAPRPAQK